MLSQFLRELMSSRHRNIEGHTLQNELASGTISKERYAKYLHGLLNFHRAFEGALVDHKDESPLKEIVEPEYFMVARLESDLKELNFNSNGKSETIEVTDNPLELLGILYVILGSKHGGKYMSKILGDAWGPEYKHHYLDPFGNGMMTVWKKFVAQIDELPLDDAERETVLKGAISGYEAFAHSSDLAVV